MTLNRREFVQLAATIGASLAWGGSARASTTGWHERRDLYPEGVASGDPDPSSVILWTRRPFASGGRRVLTLEVAEDDARRPDHHRAAGERSTAGQVRLRQLPEPQ
jgi:alkaline phosphatase D